MENTLTKYELIEQARQIVDTKTGNSGSYAWLSGAMAIFLTEQEAQQIFDVAQKYYGEENEEKTNTRKGAFSSRITPFKRKPAPKK